MRVRLHDTGEIVKAKRDTATVKWLRIALRFTIAAKGRISRINKSMVEVSLNGGNVALICMGNKRIEMIINIGNIQVYFAKPL